MSSPIYETIKNGVEANGYAFVSESVCPVDQLFRFAMNNGYGFCMEPWATRRKGYTAPLIAKVSTSEVIVAHVHEIRDLKSKLAALTEVGEAAKGWLTRYEDEVRDESEEAPCKRLVAAVDALNAKKG